MTTRATPPAPLDPQKQYGGRAAESGWVDISSALPAPPDEAERQDLLWQQLAAHFRWYNRAATRRRCAYQGLKIVTLVFGGAVTVLAALSAPAWLTASLAAAVVAIEGLQQLFQFHANWISYRATAEALRQQAFLYAAHVDPYTDPASRRERLANVIQTITATENTGWAKAMKQEVGGHAAT